MADAVSFGNALTRCGFLATPKIYLNAIQLDARALEAYTGEDYSMMISGVKYFELPAGHDVDLPANGPLIFAPHAMRAFRKLRGEALNAGGFDAAMVTMWSARQALLYRESKEEDDTIAAVKPEPLKRMKNWKSFDPKLITYLSQIRGATSTHLSYLVRSHEVPTAEMLASGYSGGNGDMFDSIDEAMQGSILFTSEFARIDNRKLFFLLEELFNNGEAEVYAKRHARSKNGRKVYLDAKLAGSGDAVQSPEVSQANGIITTYKYTGEERNYTVPTIDYRQETYDGEANHSGNTQVPDRLGGMC